MISDLTPQAIEEAETAADAQFRHVYIQLQNVSKLKTALARLKANGQEALTDDQRRLIESFFEQQPYW